MSQSTADTAGREEVKPRFVKMGNRYIILDDGTGQPIGRIDRSPMNPRVWCLEIAGLTTGLGTGHCGAAAAKKEARRLLKTRPTH